jgi:hypothetical protein
MGVGEKTVLGVGVDARGDAADVGEKAAVALGRTGLAVAVCAVTAGIWGVAGCSVVAVCGVPSSTWMTRCAAAYSTKSIHTTRSKKSHGYFITV